MRFLISVAIWRTLSKTAKLKVTNFKLNTISCTPMMLSIHFTSTKCELFHQIYIVTYYTVFSVQFWSAFMGCSTQGIDATRTFIDQIDVIKLLVKKYPDVFLFATSSSDIASALKFNRIASLVGVEGGHAIDSSLGTLRQLYDLGARYMTLTHSCNTPW